MEGGSLDLAPEPLPATGSGPDWDPPVGDQFKPGPGSGLDQDPIEGRDPCRIPSTGPRIRPGSGPWSPHLHPPFLAWAWGAHTNGHGVSTNIPYAPPDLPPPQKVQAEAVSGGGLAVSWVAPGVEPRELLVEWAEEMGDPRTLPNWTRCPLEHNHILLPGGPGCLASLSSSGRQLGGWEPRCLVLSSSGRGVGARGLYRWGLGAQMPQFSPHSERWRGYSRESRCQDSWVLLPP